MYSKEFNLLSISLKQYFYKLKANTGSMFIAPIIRTRISDLITWKRSVIFAGLYLGVLILLVPMLYSLPDKGFIRLIDNSDQANTLSRNLISALYDQNNHLPRNLDKQEGIYKSSSHTFKVVTNKLSFSAAPDEIRQRCSFFCSLCQ